MTIYLIDALSSGHKTFTDRQLAEEYLEEINYNLIFKSHIKPIELITDAFMELTLQPHKPRNKFNKELD